MSSLNEFSLIEIYFARQGIERDDVLLGIGDDAALLKVAEGMELAVAIDTLVEGRHFPVDTPPDSIGYKVLAVNLSDMAAMGAEPAWMTLSLSLPEADPDFLELFSSGLLVLAEQYGIQLVGGDTVRGPLCVTAQIHGFVPKGRAMLRSGARVGDHIYVTGTLGDAGAGLAIVQGGVDANPEARDFLVQKLERPTPRVREGVLLRDIASAAIDISDGLVADLGHILSASGVGATIELNTLPLSKQLCESIESSSERERLALSAGDDYELCFTVAPENALLLDKMAQQFECPITCIGTIEEGEGLRLMQDNGEVVRATAAGFDHFAG